MAAGTTGPLRSVRSLLHLLRLHIFLISLTFTLYRRESDCLTLFWTRARGPQSQRWHGLGRGLGATFQSINAHLSRGVELPNDCFVLTKDMRLCKRERHERVHLVAVVIPAPTNDDSDDARHLSQVAYMLRVRRTNEPWLTRERVEEGVPQFLYSLGFPFVLILTHPNTAFGINGWSNLLLGPHPTVYGVDPSKTFYLDNYTVLLPHDFCSFPATAQLLIPVPGWDGARHSNRPRVHGAPHAPRHGGRTRPGVRLLHS